MFDRVDASPSTCGPANCRRTWYKLDIRPHAYWTIWSDWLIHRIHHRVLRHIKRLAEDDGAA